MNQKSGKHCTQHTESLDSCFDLIRTHQQYIPLSPPLEIEQPTIEPKLLPLSYFVHKTYK